jgi:hypothetical protein
MNIGDYSPPDPPSLDQQRDALQKGLGRAMRWATTRWLDDDPLLEACLRDLRFDTQIDEPRGDWLWRMIREVDAVDRFRVPILHALYELSDDRSANQLCELARHYAKAGDDTFRMRLYEIVERKPIAESHWLGEEEIIQLDGEEAFLFAARVRGGLLPSRDWEWDDEMLVHYAIERFGEERVDRLLENTRDGAIGFFRERWRRQKEVEAGRGQDLPYREEMRAIPVREIISAAESKEPDFYFRGWGRYAEDADLALVLQHLSATRETNVITNLLQVFSNRAAPQFVARFIELCQQGDQDVRRGTLIALENIEHPLVREFALSELENGVRHKSVVGLFSRNFQRGDEQRILEAIEFPEDDCELHWLLMDVLKVLENNPDADCSQLGLIIYASTPCENCRFHAARLLLDQQVAPGWLIEECRYDSAKRCREMVETAEGSIEAV